MKPVKTHSFRGTSYRIIHEESPVLGWCEFPDERLEIHIQDGDDRRALAVAIHEAMHALGLRDKDVDGVDENGKDVSDHLADWLWRLGWRRDEQA